MAQTTSSYNVALTNDGAGNYTPTVLRNASSAASGGTSITIPWTENNNASPASTKTLLPGVALQVALRAIANDIVGGTTAGTAVTVSVVSTNTYNVLLSNDGAGNFTTTVLRNPSSAASGGTSVTIPWVENNNNTSLPGATKSLLLGVSLQAALRAIVNDISAGN